MDATIELIADVRSPYLIDAHSHPHFELLYIVRGSRVVRIDQRRFRAKGGDLIIFRPGVVHEETAGSKRLSFFVIRFSTRDLEKLELAFPNTEKFDPVLPIPYRERFHDLFTRMLEERERIQHDSELLHRVYLVEFVVLLRRALDQTLRTRAPRLDQPRARLRQAIRRMQEDVGSQLPLEELAKASVMSVSHFSHLFKATVGAPPKRFHIEQRIERAKELLSRTELSAQDIARELGYSDPYFFYRQFKKKTGLTAGNYRRRLRVKTR